MESVSLLKVITPLLHAEYIFNLLLSLSFSFWQLNCYLCKSLLCRTLACWNAKKFTAFLSLCRAIFTGVYCRFYCRFWLQLDFSKFLWIPKGASLRSQESCSDPTKTSSAIGDRIVHVAGTTPATPAQGAGLCFFLRRPAFSCGSWAVTTHLSFAERLPCLHLHGRCFSAWASPAARALIQPPRSCSSNGIILIAKHSWLLIMIWHCLSSTLQQLIKIWAGRKIGKELSVAARGFHVCSWNVENMLMKNYIVCFLRSEISTKKYNLLLLAFCLLISLI